MTHASPPIYIKYYAPGSMAGQMPLNIGYRVIARRMANASWRATLEMPDKSIQISQEVREAYTAIVKPLKDEAPAHTARRAAGNIIVALDAGPVPCQPGEWKCTGGSPDGSVLIWTHTTLARKAMDI